jgi:murein DD-endopeptidase MepM/ murein hydrolase activator NlpD
MSVLLKKAVLPATIFACLIGLLCAGGTASASATPLVGIKPAVASSAQTDVSLKSANKKAAAPVTSKSSPFVLAKKVGLSGPEFAEFLAALDNAKPVAAKRGQSLGDMLQKAGVDKDTTQDLLSATTKAYNPRNLRAGQQVKLLMTPQIGGQAGKNRADLMGVLIPVNLERDLMVVRKPDDQFKVMDLKRPIDRNLRLATITIRDNLYQDGAAANVPSSILSELVKTLSYDVDFQRDIHDGDRFDLLYEEQVNDEGAVVRNGGLQYVSYTIDGETKRVYRYNDGERAEFYLENGDALRRSLMRTPIDGARLTSGFGMRLHPVMNYSRMHRGVDFAAPIGTPIYAAGDGTIAFAGRFSGYGNYVKIKHDGDHATAYGHMNNFAGNIRVGARVRQGQVIGYVGRTGMATGPHLHYEVMVNGDQVNPLNVKFAGSNRLTSGQLAQFKAKQQELRQTLAQLQKQPGQRLALAQP